MFGMNFIGFNLLQCLLILLNLQICRLHQILKKKAIISSNISSYLTSDIPGDLSRYILIYFILSHRLQCTRIFFSLLCLCFNLISASLSSSSLLIFLLTYNSLPFLLCAIAYRSPILIILSSVFWRVLCWLLPWKLLTFFFSFFYVQ